MVAQTLVRVGLDCERVHLTQEEAGIIESAGAVHARLDALPLTAGLPIGDREVTVTVGVQDADKTIHPQLPTELVGVVALNPGQSSVPSGLLVIQHVVAARAYGNAIASRTGRAPGQPS